MEMSSLTTEYATSDTVEASYYRNLGHRPVRIVGTGRRKTFVFQNVPQDVIDAFLRDEAMVNPTRFMEAYRSILTFLHSTP